MIVSSPNTQQSNTAPLCVCLTYVGDNGDCVVHGKAPRRTFNPFPSGDSDNTKGEAFNVLYALAKSEGDRRFGSECKHENVKGGKCLNCLRGVR
jgi:hypothetical protein